jgi:hypothetical protein
VSDVLLSGATKALLKAAKTDAPSAATRAKVWAGVSSAVGGAAGAAGSAASATGVGTGGASSLATGGTVGGMSVAKMLVIGTLLGGAVTVGLAAVALRIGPSPSETRPAHALAATQIQTPTAAENPTATATATATATVTVTATVTATATPTAIETATAGPTPKAMPQRPRATPADALAREASLVSDARKALSRGDARAALALVRQAHALPSPQLVPEELAVESQALRALGQADEATGVDFTLKTQYPDSALAR